MPYKLIFGTQAGKQSEYSIRISLLTRGLYLPDILSTHTYSLAEFQECISEFQLETYLSQAIPSVVQIQKLLH